MTNAPGAHQALAFPVLTRSGLGRDGEGAQRAIQLDPILPLPTVRRRLPLPGGLVEEGLEHISAAWSWTPCAAEHVSLANAYYFDRQFDQALEAVRAAFDLDPNQTHFFLGRIYREKGMYEEAIAEFGKVGMPGAGVTWGRLCTSGPGEGSSRLPLRDEGAMEEGRSPRRV